MASNILTYLSTNNAENDETNEFVRINTRRGPATFYDGEDFKNAYFQYILEKNSTDSLRTDPENNCNGLQARNCIYLDGDFFCKQTEKPFGDICVELSSAYFDIWKKELKDHNISEYYNFTFIPDTFPNNKGGFHIMIFMNTLISLDIKREMYNNVKKYFGDQFKTFDDAIEGTDNYEKVFDFGPIKTETVLLPFAQKERNSRKYNLFDTTFNFDEPQSYFIFPHAYTKYDTDEHVDLNIVEENVAMNDDVMSHIKQITSNTKITFSKFGNANKLAFKFISSLMYLSNAHVFWTKLANNDIRLNEIIAPVIQFMQFNYFIEKNGVLPDQNDFANALTKLFIPLLHKTVTEETQRDSYSSAYNHICSYIKTYSGKIGSLSRRKDGDPNERSLSDFWIEYSTTMSIKDRNSLSHDDAESLGQCRSVFKACCAGWVNFVVAILAGLTDEIEPFTENNSLRSYEHRISFDDVFPKTACISNEIVNSTTFYINTIKDWCMNFMFVEYYNVTSLNESVRAILSAFSRNYIWTETTNKTQNIKIYNIKQTKRLCSYPYNQWIQDIDGENLRSWLMTMYIYFIAPDLMTSNRYNRLMCYFENLNKAGIYFINDKKSPLVPFGDPDMELRNILKNVIFTFSQERYKPPLQYSVTSSPYFPCRNGIVEFDAYDGHITFHTDNHSRYMEACTNVVYNEKYDCNCDEYKAISAMIEQIFPVEEERIYIMKLFASTLHGIGIRDVFLILYGTGADGKTTISNALQAMHGHEGLNEHCEIIEDGNRIYITNVKGMATSMKTETILISQKSGHDECGRIALFGKRYCTVMEPDPNISDGRINCSIIKELQSGTAISARHIFGFEVSFVPNALIVLQTNIMVGYNEDSDGSRRRIVVHTCRSKFYNSANSSKFKSLQYQYPQDPNLLKEITSNPKYWQAMFYYLLPYAQQLIVDKQTTISNIPKPESILMTTNASFAMSSGLIGWFNMNISKNPNCIINVRVLINQIIQSEISNRSGIFTKRTVHEKIEEAFSAIGATYTGSLYILNNKYYGKNSVVTDAITEIYDSDDVVKIFECSEEVIKSKYLSAYPINDCSSSKLFDKSDIFLLGYCIENI